MDVRIPKIYNQYEPMFVYLIYETLQTESTFANDRSQTRSLDKKY